LFSTCDMLVYLISVALYIIIFLVIVMYNPDTNGIKR